MVIRQLSVALGMVATASIVSADVLELSYVDTHSVAIRAPVSQKYFNPTSDVTVTSAAGLDRSVQINIRDSARLLVATASSSRIAASNRITVDGKDYYGVSLKVSFPGEGDYTMEELTFDSSGNLLGENTYSITIDTTPPSIAGPWGLDGWNSNTTVTPAKFSFFEGRRVWVEGVSRRFSR